MDTPREKSSKLPPGEKRMRVETESDELVNMPSLPAAGSSSENPAKQNEENEASTGGSSAIPAPSEPVAAGVASEETAGSSHEQASGAQTFAARLLYEQAVRLKNEAKESRSMDLLPKAASQLEQVIALVRDKEEDVELYRAALPLLCDIYHLLMRSQELSPLSDELIRLYQAAEFSGDPVDRYKLAKGYFYKAENLMLKCFPAGEPQLLIEVEYLFKKAMSLASNEELYRASLMFFIFSIQKLCHANPKPTSSDWELLEGEFKRYFDEHMPSLAEKSEDSKKFILIVYFWRACMYGLLKKNKKAEADLAVAQQLPPASLEESMAEFSHLTNKPLPPVVAAFLSGKRGEKAKADAVGSSSATVGKMDTTREKSSNESLIDDQQMRRVASRVFKLHTEGKFDEAEAFILQFIQLNGDKMNEASSLQIHIFLCENYFAVSHWQKLSSLTRDLIMRFRETEDTLNKAAPCRLGVLYFYQARSIVGVFSVKEAYVQTTIYKNLMSLLTKAKSLGLTPDIFHRTSLLIFTLRIKRMFIDKPKESELKDLRNDLEKYIDEECKQENLAPNEGNLVQARFFRGHVYRILNKETNSTKDLMLLGELPVEMRRALESDYPELVNMPPIPAAGSSSDNAEKQNEENEMSTGGSSAIPVPSEPVAAGVASEETAGSSHGQASGGELSAARLLYQEAKHLIEESKKSGGKDVSQEVADRLERGIPLLRHQVLVGHEIKDIDIYQDAVSLLCDAYHVLLRFQELSSLSDELISIWQYAEYADILAGRNLLGKGYFYKAKSLISKCFSAGKLQPQICQEVERLLEKASTLISHEELMHDMAEDFFMYSIKKSCCANFKPSGWKSLQDDFKNYIDTYGPSLAEKSPKIKHSILAVYFWRACMYGLLGKGTEAEADLEVLVQRAQPEVVKQLMATFPALTAKPLPALVAAFLTGKREQAKPTPVGNSTALALTWLGRRQAREELLLEEVGKAYELMQSQSFGEAQLALKQVNVVLVDRGMTEEEQKKAEALVRGEAISQALVHKKGGHGKGSKKGAGGQNRALVAQGVGVEMCRELAGKLLTQVVIYTRRREGWKVKSVMDRLKTWDVETLGADNYRNMLEIRCGTYTGAFRKGKWARPTDWRETVLELSVLSKDVVGFCVNATQLDIESQRRFSSYLLSLLESVMSYATQTQRGVLSDRESAEHGVIVELLKATQDLSQTLVEEVKAEKKKRLTPEQESQNYSVRQLSDIHTRVGEIFATFSPAAWKERCGAEKAAASSAREESSATLLRQKKR